MKIQKIIHPDAKVWHDSIEIWEQVLANIRTQDVVEWLVADNLRGQRVLTTFTQDICMEDTKEKFKQIFHARKNPYFTAKPRPIDDWLGLLVEMDEFESPNV